MKVTLNGETKVLSISEGTSLLEAAEEVRQAPHTTSQHNNERHQQQQQHHNGLERKRAGGHP